MNLDPQWIPMKWPGGPLEVRRRARAQTLSPEVKEMLGAWVTPETLELIKGTPVNCLVVEWAAGEPEDRNQQNALAPLVKAGRQMGISFVGKVSGIQDAKAAVARGVEVGLAGLLLEKPPAAHIAASAAELSRLVGICQTRLFLLQDSIT